MGAISHIMENGLYLVVKVIKAPLSKQLWTVECGRVCYVLSKGALSWALEILPSEFTAGRGWSQNIGQAPRYDIAMNHVFCCPYSAQARADLLNPPTKQRRVDLAHDVSSQHSAPSSYAHAQQPDTTVRIVDAEANNIPVHSTTSSAPGGFLEDEAALANRVPGSQLCLTGSAMFGVEQSTPEIPAQPAFSIFEENDVSDDSLY